jgi:GMP synthase (glutamine-hydrolysing)
MIFIVDFGSTKTREIEGSLTRLQKRSQIVKWEEPEKTEWNQASAIILSGAPVLLTETDPEIYLKPYFFLKETEIPVLGICFGHQLIGMHYGSKIFKGDPVRIETRIHIIENEPLFSGFEKQTTMAEDHTEGITLPDSFIKLASSEKYEVEAMKHPSKKMYGIQFHPEVSGENGLRLFSNFCRMI